MDDVSLSRFRQAFWRAFREADGLRLRQWERSSVTLPQLRVLHYLRRHPGATTGELARRLGITVSTTSGLVIKLVDRGLVARGSLADDRRQAPLSLSDGGAALLGELSDEARTHLGEVAERLGNNLETVIQALELLSAASIPEPDAAPVARDLRAGTHHKKNTLASPSPEQADGLRDAPAQAGTYPAREAHHHA
ncbi:MAG: MarR family winged helix-turn-helix transcriptional regulator [Chloroflexota bacterium]